MFTSIVQDVVEELLVSVLVCLRASACVGGACDMVFKIEHMPYHQEVVD